MNKLKYEIVTRRVSERSNKLIKRHIVSLLFLVFQKNQKA